jgi:hypothetical protein
MDYRISGFEPKFGWVLKLAFNGKAPQLVLSCSALDTDTHHLALATTSGLLAGEYQVVFFSERPGERKTLSTSRLTVAPNPVGTTNILDFRSFEEQMLDAIEALIMRRASNAQLDMIKSSIDGKEFERMNANDLLRLRDKFKAKVLAQKGRSIKRILYHFNGIGG